eukprot:TRINITY_DN928_c0_g1_i2.p1 TRINITY_DN928_c0_g1~~TRINITY_DN928_c0_g1_i2.p1  ORF type:complete len:189 (-),score=39.12 TRINITY_DN928_c0_g1_i2:51-617(-)
MCAIEKYKRNWQCTVMSVPADLRYGQVVDILVPRLNDLNIVRPLVPLWSSIVISIKKGAGLAAKDLNGKSDPFVMVSTVIEQQQEVIFKTKIKHETLNPVWKDATFQLDYSPDLSILHFNVKDHDRFTDDENLGWFEVDISCIPMNQVHERWFPLNLEVSSKNRKKKDRINVNTMGKLLLTIEKISTD